MSHHVTITPPTAASASTSESDSLELVLLQSLKSEVTAHLEAFPTDFRSSHLTLSLDGFDVRADEVIAVVSIRGVINDSPCDERFGRTVNIRAARNKHAAKKARTVGSVSTDVAASMALGVIGLALVNAVRMSNLHDDQRSRFEKGEASDEEIQFGAEAAAVELYQGLYDALLSRLDAVVGRKEAVSVSRWKTISLVRWVFALVNSAAIVGAFHFLHKKESLAWAFVWGLFIAPIAFFVVHFSGIMAMPADFFQREAAGRAAMKFSGVKSVRSVRILAAIGMLMLAAVLAWMWYVVAMFD